MERTPGKHRLYSEDVLKTIEMIKQLQKHHFTLEEINKIFKKSGCEPFKEANMAIGIKEILEQMETQVIALQAFKKNARSNPLAAAVCSSLILQGAQIMQMLLLLLGEPMG